MVNLYSKLRSLVESLKANKIYLQWQRSVVYVIRIRVEISEKPGPGSFQGFRTC